MENIFYWFVGYDAKYSTSYHRKNAQVGDKGVQSVGLDFFEPVVEVYHQKGNGQGYGKMDYRRMDLYKVCCFYLTSPPLKS